MPALLVVLGLLQFAASDELGYRFSLPEGFVALPEARGQQNIVDCWTELAPASASGGLVLCVQRMRGTLGRERMRPEDLPPATHLVRFQWKGFDIDGLHTDTAHAGSPVVVLVAPVPLRREAIQLLVTGPRDQTARAQVILASTLSTLEGETNWLTDAERAERLGTAVGWWIAIAVAVIVVVLWRKRRARAA
jgi:hypothetical protein